jgi:DNA-directed RNA polymerase subunit RPC12/RpoP
MKTQIKVPKLNNECPTPEQLTQAQNLIHKHQQSVTQQVENTLIICPHCQHEQLIKSTTLVKDYYYEEPWGCSGGDRYRENDTSLYLCNECSKLPSLPEPLKIHSKLFNDIKYRRDNKIHDNYY